MLTLARTITAKSLCFAALAITGFVSCAHAQSNAPGPFATPSGALQFTRTAGGFVVALDEKIFDRFRANTLTHFDETSNDNPAVMRTLVQTRSGPVLYDFRHRPPRVQRAAKRMVIRRVFWQGNEVVLQSSRGWFRLEGGVLTKLHAFRTTYH